MPQAVRMPMIGQTLGHYRIVEKLGEGGMGVVYLAHDERLDRDVAVKVLRPGLLADEALRKRFRKEALALSRLNHPNIATIYDFDADQNLDFLVMEHVAGSTLSERLSEGPVEEKEIARLGSQLAEGLAAAHEKGVVHRDLKPGNLRMTPDGRLKILDFGLAKLSQTGADGTTMDPSVATHAAAGTLPYMAPEQVLGGTVDARSDIYACGAVLYELATGKRPFQSSLAGTVAGDILHKTPVLPGRLNPEISPRLEQIVLKCLEKNPDDRYQTAKELLVDLRRLGAAAASTTPDVLPMPARTGEWGKPYVRAAAGVAALLVVLAALVVRRRGDLRSWLPGRAGSAHIESLAVLPLQNLSNDPEQEYFADGMTEELIASLSRISALRVISRTSVMRYKGTKKSLPEIAQELNVDALVEGSVLRSGDRVRITAQLIEGPTDRHLWAEDYERDLRNVLTLQNEVAKAIAGEIRIKVTPEEQTRLAKSQSVTPEAYQDYLKGRYFWRKFDATDNARSIEYFQQALAKDPGYALAYTGLSDAYVFVTTTGGDISSVQAMLKAKAAAEKALALDDSLSEAHFSLALVDMYYAMDWSGADREFRRSLTLNPSNAEAHHFYSHYHMAMREVKESLAESQRALELDPLSPDLVWHMGWHYYYARQFDQAIPPLQKGLEMAPSSLSARLFLGRAYEQKGEFAKAIQELQEVRREAGSASPYGLADLGRAYALSGNRTEAERILQQMKEFSTHRPIPGYSFATLYVALGDKERAIAALQESYKEAPSFNATLSTDPRFDPIRSDPRFVELLRLVGLPQ